MQDYRDPGLVGTVLRAQCNEVPISQRHMLKEEFVLLLKDSHTFYSTNSKISFSFTTYKIKIRILLK